MAMNATESAGISQAVPGWRAALMVRGLVSAGAAMALTACAGTGSPDRIGIAFSASAASDSAIDVHISDAAPSDSLRLRLASSGLRERTWTPLGAVRRVDDTTFDMPGGGIAGFRIATDKTEQDRIYPGLVSLGQSFVVNLDYLVTEGPASHVALQSRDLSFVGDDCSRSNEQTLPLDGERLDGPRGRYVVLDRDGEVPCEASSTHTLITGMGTPQWLADHVSRTLSRQLAGLTEIFGTVPQSHKPRLVIAYDPDPAKPSRYRGEAGWRSTIFIRFQGTAWRAPDPQAEAALAAFVTHEAVHLWMGQGARMAPEDRTALLTEGAAEYLSWLLVNGNPRPDAPATMEEAARRASDCNGTVGDRSLGKTPLSGRAYYDCGFVVQWLADLEAVSRDGTRIQDIWRKLLNDGPEVISLDTFLDASRAPNAGTWLMAVSASGRIDAIAASARGAFEVDREGAFPAQQATGLALMHILGGQCRNGAFGFYQEGNRIRLDTGDRCGALSGDPVVEKVNGRNVLTGTEALLDAVSTACRQGEDLTLTGEDDRVVATVACKVPLELPARPVRITPVPRKAPPE